MPIFSAGATQSKVRQARYHWNAAKSALDVVSRQTEQQARDAYQGVISQIAQVQALKQAVESNRVSLQATEAGYEVGTKTALDVLTARAAAGAGADQLRAGQVRLSEQHRRAAPGGRQPRSQHDRRRSTAGSRAAAAAAAGHERRRCGAVSRSN